MKIEKNIPIPAKKGRPKTALTLALEKMEIGDSILISNIDRKKLYNQIYVQGKKLKFKFTCRVDEDGNQRIWRKE